MVDRRTGILFMLLGALSAPVLAAQLRQLRLADGSVISGEIESIHDGIYTVTSPSITPPHITIGDAGGAPGTQVTVAIALTKNGPNIVTVGNPLTISFDPAVLSFGSCSKAAGISSGKSLNAATPSAGQLTLVLAGDLVTIADGDIIDCTFSISAGATPGSTTPLTFVTADLSDDEFNDYFPTGTNGTVSCASGAGVPTLSEWGRIVFACLAFAFVLWQTRGRLGAS